MNDVRVLPDARAVVGAASEEFSRRARAAVRERGSFGAALTAGTTLLELYRFLAADPSSRSRVPWGRVELFAADERQVPPDHPDSLYRAAYEGLFSGLPERGHLWRFWSEAPDPGIVASYFEDMVRKVLRPKPGETPDFDLVLFELGTDGRLASLLPGSPALREDCRFAVAPWVEDDRAHRFTLGPAAIHAAGAVVVLAVGADRARALGDALEGDAAPDRSPARLLLAARGEVVWLVDQAAASRLTARGSRP